LCQSETKAGRALRNAKVQRKETVMFGHITNLAQTRSITGAVGFYLFYTILLVGLSTFLGHYLHTFGVIDTVVGGFFDGGSIHTLIGTGWVMIVSSMILSGKKLTGDLMAVILTVVGIYLAYTVNVLLGMVVVSYLTTLGK
jgi:hypothetical protein